MWIFFIAFAFELNQISFDWLQNFIIFFLIDL